MKIPQIAIDVGLVKRIDPMDVKTTAENHRQAVAAVEHLRAIYDWAFLNNRMPYEDIHGLWVVINDAGEMVSHGSSQMQAIEKAYKEGNQ